MDVSFYSVNTDNLFYNIASIVIGVFLLIFSIMTIYKKKLKLFGILGIIHSALFVFFGIWGFFLPKDYMFITVLGMLALCITMTIVILLLYKKEPANK